MLPQAQYLWQDGTPGPEIIVNGAGLYSVQVTTDCYILADSAYLSIPTPPPGGYISDTTLCEGDAWTAYPVISQAQYLWQDGTPGATIIVDSGGLYSVQVITDCYTVNDTAYVSFPPLPHIDLGPDTAICPDGTVFVSAPQGYASFAWNDGITFADRIVSEPGTYVCTVMDICGLSATDSLYVAQKDCRCFLYMPNAFTPDADGMNDEIGPVYDCELRQYHLAIFDRWGEVIFTSDDPLEPWDGSTSGGPVQIGSYAYRLSYRSMHEPGVVDLLGHVSVLR